MIHSAVGGPSTCAALGCTTWLAIILVATFSVQGAKAQRPCKNPSDKGLLSLSTALEIPASNVISDAMKFEACHSFRLDPTALAVPQCEGSDKYLILEFYRMQLVNGVLIMDTATALTGIFISAAFSTPSNQISPQVSLDNLGNPVYEPELNSGTGSAGSFTDLAATKYQRAYQRILVPGPAVVDSTTISITVTNLAYLIILGLPEGGLNTSIPGYQIRATCEARVAIPCARPLPDKDVCSNTPGNVTNGVCTAGNYSTLPGVAATCACIPAWADFGCQVSVPVVPGSGAPIEINSMPRGSWIYRQVQVPEVVNNVSNYLLVELSRSSSSAMNADPFLFLKPAMEPDHNLPSYIDLSAFADDVSWRLEQNYHYMYIRMLVGGTFYIAILNDNELCTTKDTPGSCALTATLTVTWTTPQTPYSCPGIGSSCSGLGKCLDPIQLPAATWPSQSRLLPAFKPQQGYYCDCNAGLGGLNCEGPLNPIAVNTNGQTVTGTLAAGGWSFYLLNINVAGLRDSGSSVEFTWNVVGANAEAAAYYIINQDGWPRQSDYSFPLGTFQRGIQQYFSPNSGPLTFSGKAFQSESVYLLSVYNQAYSSSSSFTYSLSVLVPSASGGGSWLHTYIAVVLGVAAAIVLCMLMTIFKRVMMRSGVGPWRQEEEEGGGGHAMLQLVARRQGVPQAMIDKFEVFTYGVTKEVAGPDGEGDKTPITRPEREALQAAAAEAATTAAVAARTQAELSNMEPTTAPPAHPGPLRGTASLERSSSLDPATTAAGAVAASVVGGLAGSGGGAASEVEGGAVKTLPVPLSSQQEDAVVAAARAAAAVLVQASKRAPSLPIPGEAGSLGRVVDVTAGPTPLVPTVAVLPPVNEDECCTVCLCEYEEGDSMRRLPCNHEFHRACIDKWMTQHTTCPICREPLVPAEYLASQEAEEQEVAVIFIPPAHASPNDNTWQLGAVAELGRRLNLAMLGRPTATPPANTSTAATPVAQPVGSQAAARRQPAGSWSAWGEAPTQAWGRTEPTNDPFASPLPMQARSARPNSGRRRGSPGSIAPVPVGTPIYAPMPTANPMTGTSPSPANNQEGSQNAEHGSLPGSVASSVILSNRSSRSGGPTSPTSAGPVSSLGMR